jgi:8-oxo-dGTP pyrophosphatase MutT (NUDIX family)
MKNIPHQLTDNMKLLQKAVLIYDGKCLILKRSEDEKSRPGKWDLPGGNAEWPTSKKDIQDYHIEEILREIHEETGIIINDFSLESCYVGTYYKADSDVFTVILGWTAQLSQLPDVKISHEHTEFAWMALEEGSQYDFGFAGEKGGFIRTMIDRSLGQGSCCGGGCGGGC